MAGTMDMEKYKEMLSPRSVYNGRYTVLKLGNVELAECYANKAQTKINKETVPRCGTDLQLLCGDIGRQHGDAEAAQDQRIFSKADGGRNCERGLADV